MYAVTSMPEVSRTRATLRRAEFGFFGVAVYTRVQTPRRWGDPLSAGALVFSRRRVRPWRTSCWIVGMVPSVCTLDLSIRGPDVVEAGPRARLPGWSSERAQVVPLGNPLEAHAKNRARPPSPAQ